MGCETENEFPLYPRMKFDIAFENSYWPVGIQSTAPKDLKMRIAAAIGSHFLRLKSIDGYIKRYLDEVDFDEGNAQRLDLHAMRCVDDSMKVVTDAISEISGAGEKSMGEVVGEWTIARAPFAMDMLLSCANRGALFEPLAIARMLLEQLAFALCSIAEKDEAKIKTISAQSSLRYLKSVFPESGRLYGWLSGHAHWKYEFHLKSYIVEEGHLSHLFASCQFKAVAMSVGLVLNCLCLRIARNLTVQNPALRKHDLITHLDECDSASVSLLKRIRDYHIDDRDISSLAAIAAGV